MCKDNIFSSFTICCGERIVEFRRPAVLGILNATPDSFYDGGRYNDDDHLLARAEQMVAEGVDIIDIGVVSSRPGAQLLAPDEEAARLAPVVKLVRQHCPDVLISVDTCFSLPARAAVEVGADIVNDISGGDYDEAMFETVAELGVPYILMHHQGTPDRMQVAPHYDDLLQEVAFYLSQRVDRLRLMGVKDVIIDPGFGFGKSIDHNYELMAHLSQFRMLFPNEPLLVALSRKSMIYKLVNATPDDALAGTVALHAAALMKGAQLLRVHDVREARQTIDVISKMLSFN